MTNVTMFPFMKSKRALEVLASGGKPEAPKGYAETKAKIERINSRPADDVIEDFAIVQAKKLTDELFRKASNVASATVSNGGKQSHVPDNAADLHFLVNSFMVDYIKSVSSSGDFKSTFAVSDPALTTAYRTAVTEAITGKHPKGSGNKNK